MTRMWKGRRILSLVLALAMIMTMMPSMALPIYSENTTDQATTPADTTETSADTPNYGALVGATAQFNIATYINFTVDNDPSTFNDDYYEGEWATHENYLYYDLDDGQCDFDADLTLVITDWYANPKTFGLWFKVEAAPGYTLPDMLAENPWVFQNWYDIYAEEDWEEISQDVLIITVPDGVYDAATGITVTGVPADATVSVKIPEIEGEILPDIYDIKILVSNAEGELVEWQPAAGETVRVSLPVSSDAKAIDVVHFLENPEIIKYMLDNQLLEAFDVSVAVDDEKFFLLEPAVKAYQEAMESIDVCIVAEGFEDVPVVNGVAAVDANGFSVFTTVDPITENTNSFENLPDTVYVRPDEWIDCAVSGFIATIRVAEDPNSITELISGTEFAFLGEADNYVHVSRDATKDQYFEINAWRLYPYVNKTVRFIVVDDFDYGNVYIGVVDHNKDFLDDLDEHTNALPDRYYNGATLVTSQTIYSQRPNALINLNAVKDSNDTVFNSIKTVYGVRDPSGALTSGFFWTEVTSENTSLNPVFFNQIEEDIMTEYFALEEHKDLNPNNYMLVPYTVKHETVGSNAGWYVNCKVVLKATYLLTYDYNFPEGFDVFDIKSGSKPSDRAFSTENADTDGKLTVSVGPYDTVTIQTILNNGTQNQTVTATLKGWSKSKDSTTAEYSVGTTTYESFEMYGNTTLYGVWEMTSGNWVYNTFNWTVRNTLVDSQNKPVSGSTEFSYEITAQNAGTFPLTYELYDEYGQSLGNFEFVANTQNQALTFTLKGNQYIVISGIQTTTGSAYPSLTLTQTSVPDGYTCNTTTIQIDVQKTNTPATGKLSSNVVNEQNTYAITYNLDGGTNHTDNPVTYTVEDQIVLREPSREDYNFAGWKVTTATGTWQTGTVYRDSLVIAAGQYGNVTLTAQWERALTTLTIKVEGCDTQLDADQSFIFTVTSNTTGENVDVDVTVLGNGQVCISGLVIGNSYTITMQTSWSWRYEADSIAATVDGDEIVEVPSVTTSLEDGETIVFTVQRINSQWLDWFGGLFSNGN